MTEATGHADDSPKTGPANDAAADNEASKNAVYQNAASKDAAPESKTDAPSLEATMGSTKGTSLAPAAEKPSGIDPFIAIAAADAPAAATAPRPFYAKALDYSAHAAMVVGLVGFAWTVSDHVVSRHPADQPAAAVKHADAAIPAVTPKPVEAAKVDPVDDLRKTNQKMASEIRNLRASLEALRTTVVRERTSGAAPDESRAEIRALSASIDNLKSSLAGTKSEQSASLAQLSAKLEKLQREEKAPQPIVDRKPERQQLDTSTTASIPPVPAKAVPTPPSKPATLALSEPDDGAANADKPQVISGWIVRDVYQGVALIEGRRGQMEVVPGVSIPGAGTVKSIERHNGTWTVTTTKGQFASAAPQQHEQQPRRGYRDYYGPRRWDF